MDWLWQGGTATAEGDQESRSGEFLFVVSGRDKLVATRSRGGHRGSGKEEAKWQNVTGRALQQKI